MFSEIRWMRIIVFYDLPVSTKRLRQIYQRFHNYLLKEGYDMLQYSVYCRLCNGHDAVEKYIRRIELNAPEYGNVRIMKVTEKQYSQMYFLVGQPSTQEKINKEQKQLLLF